MTEETVFFDTYAFFEAVEGNPAYEKFCIFNIVTSIFNLVELNYAMKREKGKEIADKYLDKYISLVVSIISEDIKNATDLMLKNKDMSMPDAIGYVIAKRLEIKFVTGDNDFKDIPNVEFV